MAWMSLPLANSHPSDVSAPTSQVMYAGWKVQEAEYLRRGRRE